MQKKLFLQCTVCKKGIYAHSTSLPPVGGRRSKGRKTKVESRKLPSDGLLTVVHQIFVSGTEMTAAVETAIVKYLVVA